MKKVKFVRVDVFASKPFQGNALAVFPDAKALTSREMQLLANEMNLSETTFVVPPTRGSGADFRVRIFVPDMEIPYAGHPTVGTFYVLARLGKIKLRPPITVSKMESMAGVLPVEIHSRGKRISKVVTVQNRPEFMRTFEDPSPFARALSLGEDDLDTERMPIEMVSTGLPWVILPVTSRKAVERARGNAAEFAEAMKGLPKEVGFYVTCLDPLKRGSTTHSRGFALVSGNVVEDPATGSASGDLGAYLVRHGLIEVRRITKIVNEQGYEINRPSRIEIEVRTAEDGTISSVKVGGSVVHVMDGTAYI
jgi:trans-2,3-dihydro-3-hydroxyanthranilate isomerase